MELNQFLVSAKTNTYASENAVKRILEDGARELVYENGIFRYRDRYYGFNPFIGEELVWENGKLVWVMNYFGGVYHEVIDLVRSEEIYDFLKLSLRQVPEDKPFRGPTRRFKNSNFSNFAYNNEVWGNISCFHGTERIMWIGEKKEKLWPYQPLYALVYHGGTMGEKGLEWRSYSG
ncbi:MAG: hypothetical protein HYV51_02865 [Parcubacteria group bacterium]|nr:hypothetical protein [Parcubacteria group bacterium]